MSAANSNELSPQKTYRLMASMALAMMCLLGVAIYSLSRLSESPFGSRLSTPDIQSTSRQDLPHFEVVSDGETINAAYFDGHWTLLTFWSYACPPCVEEMPALNSMTLGWQGPEFRVMTVNWDEGENLDLAKRFLQEEEIYLPTIWDKDETMKKAFAVTEFPRHFLIGPDRKIVWAATGAFAWDKPAARDQLLKLMELQAPETTPDPVE